MEQKPTIYTYGNIGINANEFVQLLQPHDINCVVDCRPQTNSRIARNSPTDELKTILAQHNIIYPSSPTLDIIPQIRETKKEQFYTKEPSAHPNSCKGLNESRMAYKKAIPSASSTERKTSIKANDTTS